MPSLYVVPPVLLPMEEVIERIIFLNTGLARFWADHTWAPRDVRDALSSSRLDWQVSLSHSLRRWHAPPSADESEAVIILAYVNLGALVENTLKLFLTIYLQDYRRDANASRERLKKNRILASIDGMDSCSTSESLPPGSLKLNLLKEFFQKQIWVVRDDYKEDDWDPWISKVQYRRNAVHAFKHREIGMHDDLLKDIRIYLRFLRRINGQLPYPAGVEVHETAEPWKDEFRLDCSAPQL